MPHQDSQAYPAHFTTISLPSTCYPSSLAPTRLLSRHLHRYCYRPFHPHSTAPCRAAALSPAHSGRLAGSATVANGLPDLTSLRPFVTAVSFAVGTRHRPVCPSESYALRLSVALLRPTIVYCPVRCVCPACCARWRDTECGRLIARHCTVRNIAALPLPTLRSLADCDDLMHAPQKRDSRVLPCLSG